MYNYWQELAKFFTIPDSNLDLKILWKIKAISTPEYDKPYSNTKGKNPYSNEQRWTPKMEHDGWRLIGTVRVKYFFSFRIVYSFRLGVTAEYPATIVWIYRVLLRTSQITIDAILIQWHANQRRVFINALYAGYDEVPRKTFKVHNFRYLNMKGIERGRARAVLTIQKWNNFRLTLKRLLEFPYTLSQFTYVSSMKRIRYFTCYDNFIFNESKTTTRWVELSNLLVFLRTYL